MTAAPVVRRIDPGEWQAYRDIRLRALKDSPDAFGSTLEEASQYTDAMWRERVERASTATDLPLFAVVEETPVGLAWARIDAPANVAHLYQMWVAPDARGQGVGRLLVNEAIEWSRSRGVVQLILEVTIGNAPARHLYEVVGFIPTGEPLPLRPGGDLMEQTMVLEL